MKPALPTFEAPPAAAPVSIPRPLAYHIIVEPREPDSTSKGGILFAQKTRRANRATDTIGIVKAIGQFAWQAKTPELDWSLLENPPGVGDWVIFKQHAGQKLRLRTEQGALIAGDQEDEQYLIIMADTDIMGVLTPEQAKQFYSWA